jgi:holo-[acyl-carrier protein] synthase
MSSAKAIGVDLVEISRIRAIHKRHGKKFFDRVLTRAEQAYCLTRGDPYPSIAARVAAKESVAKALGVGIGEHLRWTSISIENLPSGAPQVILDVAGKKMLKKLRAKKVLLSLSHTGDISIAMAVLK